MEPLKLIEHMRGAISEQHEAMVAMDKQLEKVSAELLGFKLAFIRLAAFLPLTTKDATAVREQAFAAAEDATESADMSHDTKLIVFSTIQSVTALAGVGWRQRTEGD